MLLVDANKQRAKVEALGKWRRWFAWHPVRLRATGDVVWWEYVERRTEFVSGYGRTFTYYRRPE
jgi:hypothetical protein